MARMGRPKGSLNKATAEIKELAREFVPEALTKLARLMRSAKSEQARVAAIKEIFDRAYGKAPQSLDLNAKIDGVAELLSLIDGRSRGLPKTDTETD